MERPILFDEHVSPADALQLIDDTIKQYQAYILNLRGQRNTIVPISRLPPELLCKIFMIVRIDSPEDSDDESKKARLAWIRLTHVSRHWRNVAISSPQVWAIVNNPILDNLPWLERSLTRSQDADLMITVDGGMSATKDTFSGLKFALEHSRRVRSLFIKAYPRDWQNVQGLLPDSAPRLTHLSLMCFKSSNSANRKPMYGLDHFLRDLPNLCHLSLVNFGVNWNSPTHLKHDLTYLKLQGVTIPMWRQFLAALTGMPNLEVLIIYDTLPLWTEGEQVPRTSTPLHFPFLRTLSIDLGKTKSLEVFLSSVTFPSTTEVRIECFEPAFSSLRDHLPDFLSALTLNVHHDFQSLFLTEPFPPVAGVRLKLFVDVLTYDQMLTQEDTTPCLDLTICWSEQTATLENTTTIVDIIFAGVLPLQSISCFWLVAVPLAFDARILADSVGKLTQVQSVIASRNAHRFLVDALQLGLDSKPIVDSPYFPNVSSITLHGKQWDKNDYRYTRYHNSYLHVTTSELYYCLSLRSRIKDGTTLQRLTCREYPKLTEDEAEKFKEVVRELDWNVEEGNVNSLSSW